MMGWLSPVICLLLAGATWGFNLYGAKVRKATLATIAQQREQLLRERSAPAEFLLVMKVYEGTLPVNTVTVRIDTTGRPHVMPLTNDSTAMERLYVHVRVAPGSVMFRPDLSDYAPLSDPRKPREVLHKKES